MTEEIKEEPKKEQPKKFIEVRVVQSQGKGAVVEWVSEGRAFRKIAPLSKLKDGKIEEKDLEKCPDYGVPWAKEIKLSATSEDLENALHNAGIWTPQDALKNSQAILGALNATYKSGLSSILKTAQKYKNKE
jgi:hypothetical protein